MVSKNILYKKQIVRKKMLSIISFGIIFLISTITYYFVNNSKAQNLLRLEAFVVDQEAVIEETSYEIKAEGNEENYTVKLPAIQNGFVVNKYILISKAKYNKLTEKEDGMKIAEISVEENTEKVEEEEEIKNEVIENIVENTDTDNDIVNEIDSNEIINEEVEENKEVETKQEEDKKEDKQIETKEEINEEKEEFEALPGQVFDLGKQEIETKSIYLLAVYDKKEVNDTVLYNKIISTKTEKNSIIISGYMPQNAIIKTTEVDIQEVENKIKDKTQNEVKLQIAYDIKIVVDDKEYEPNEFDENVKVQITDIDSKNINVWHIKDDENVEKMNFEKVEEVAKFYTKRFSIYGIEVLEETKEEGEEEKQDKNEINEEQTNKIIESKEENKEEPSKVGAKGGPLRAPASNLPDSTLVINDYTSDYNYYMGKNYTDNITGTNSNTYSSSNLISVTVNYHGFAENETDPEKKGRISLTETDDIVRNIRCLPIINGNVSIELMDNPFMDKPTGYGFGGWTYNGTVVTKDTNTKAQTLTISASGDITVNLYTYWAPATVVYLNGDIGADDADTGLTEDSPFGSWGKACQYLLQNSTNTNDRELNIIVLTGAIEYSINNTQTTHDTSGYQYSYNTNSSITSGNTYVLANGTGAGNYAISASGNSAASLQLSSTTEPSTAAQWVIESNGTNYRIRNASTGRYLNITYSNRRYSITLNTSTTYSWTYNNGRFSMTANNNTCYLYYNNGWASTTSSGTATTTYLLTYEYGYAKSNSKDTRASNSYYASNNNLALTVTSLYNHTDYREDAVIDLSAANSYTSFTIYKDFQMNHVKINATGYTTNSSGTSFTANPMFTGRTNNVRIGRGIECANTTDTGCTFANLIGGGVSSTTSTDAYKLVVESGKYSSIQGFNPNGDNEDYYGTVYLTLGSDVDRANENNSDLSTYYRTTINSGYGLNGTSTNEKAFLINVKSGEFGVDFFEENKNSSTTANRENIAYSGIYMGGYGASADGETRDRADRYMIVEGGLIANIIGGLKTTSNSNVETRIYVKGGEAYNIVGGAGRSTTYEDRIIQVTGGIIRYSVTGGSNGVYSTTSDNGVIENCDTLLYIGGNAQIGTAATLSETLYEVAAGCVLGAGNGKSTVPSSGQVDTTHIIINDNAHILNSVYGGGNYGIVSSTGSTTGTTLIEILGGTIDQNVFGGANQNDINGSTTINVKGGQIIGAVYGGSNVKGTVATTSTLNITGGTLGTIGNTNPVLFGGGKGTATIVTNGTTVNISDTDGNTTIYGNAYGGSAEGKIGVPRVTYSVASTITAGQQYIIADGTGQGAHAIVMPESGTTFTSQTLDGQEPSDYMLWIPTGTNPYTLRNVARNTYYIRYNYSLAASTTSTSWTYNNNKLVYNNNRYLRYNNGWTTSTNSGSSGTTLYFLTTTPAPGNAETYVKISDNAGNSNSISITGNVFAGGQGTASNSAAISGNSTIEVDGANLPNANIFGGNDVNGTTAGDITVKIGEHYSTTLGNVYGGGKQDATGLEASSVKVYLCGYADVADAFNGGQAADLITNGTSDTTREIYLQGGHADNIFGGSDTSGTVTASHVYIQSGSADNVYGGNNQGGQTTTSFVYIQGGTVTNVYGGGYLATTPTTNVSLTGGTIINGFGGGESANVTTSYIELDGTTSTNIFGGSNELGTVNGSNVTITSGTVKNVYGGNNAGGNTVNTNVIVTSTAVNVYGGGKDAVTSGNTNVNINNANIIQVQEVVNGETVLVGGNVFGGGKGVNAVVQGNSTTFVQGTTSIANDLFGGGDAAPNGTQLSANSLVKTHITGGTIAGDVYGAANTSVVYGDTEVKIGVDAVNNNLLTKGTISIGGTVFGGGKSNTAGSAHYDFDFESVTGDANIDIDANGYDNGVHTFTIGRSVFGSGNAAKISGDGYVNISNYGSSNNLKENISIQRATQVVFDNCNVYLKGTTDTTNEIATAVYTFNRIDNLVIKNSTTLYLESGVNIVSRLESRDALGGKAEVIINNGQITRTNNNDNRIFLLEGKNIILKTEEGTHGEVYGMTYVGIFKGAVTRTKGIYDIDTYTEGDTIPNELKDIFERNSYVQGKHYTSHNIREDGFYTNYDNNGSINTTYIIPTPDAAAYYQWIVGKITTDIYYEDIELIGTKYATTATYVLPLSGLSFPNTVVKVVGFDVSGLEVPVTFNEPNTIPNIAATGNDADTKFGLTMTAGNEGWQTRGTTNFLDNTTNQHTFSGTTQYLSDNSNTTPSFSFYLAHSKNISSTHVLGEVKISLEVNYVEDGVMQQRNAYIIIRLSINNSVTGIEYYEGAITPGKQYSMFPTTTTTITRKSSFSAYYSLFINRYSYTNYYTGFVGMYYHVLSSSCVLPENTKITLMDRSGSTVKYYYYIVTHQDEYDNRTVFEFTDFKAMDSTDEPYSSDGIYYNSTTDLLYEEFIIHVDFEDITLAQSLESQSILVQLRDIFDDTVAINVNTSQYPMLFSVYNNLEATATIDLTTDRNIIHMGDTIDMDIETQYRFSKNPNQDTVYDTTNIDNQLGVRITISRGSNMLSSTNLQGIYISYNGTNYYARSDGSYRIKIADAVANVMANMELHTENGSLETGTYLIRAQSFGSTDGTYYSTAIAEDSESVQIVSANYGFVVSLNEESVIIDKTTGKGKNDSNNLSFTIGYSGNFSTPKVVVSLYRRKYDNIYSYEYEQVDLSTYVTNALTTTSVQKEYLVTSNVQASQNYTLTTRTNLMTGTYKIRFSLYDDDILIANMDKSVIIK